MRSSQPNRSATARSSARRAAIRARGSSAPVARSCGAAGVPGSGSPENTVTSRVDPGRRARTCHADRTPSSGWGASTAVVGSSGPVPMARPPPVVPDAPLALRSPLVLPVPVIPPVLVPRDHGAT